MFIIIYNNVCKFCKNKFITNKSNIKYCNSKCRKLSYKKGLQIKRCIQCNNDFKSRSKRNNFCSRKCWKDARIIKLNYNLKEYIFEHSNFICRECNIRTPNLDIHHIKPLYKGGKDEISNLQILCEKCHMKKHGVNGGD